MEKTTKSQILEPTVLGPTMIDAAKEHVFQPKPVNKFPCRICSTSGATDKSDGLCWVCRRLKISAWQGSDVQEAASE